MIVTAMVVVMAGTAAAQAQTVDPYEPDLAPPMSVTPETWTTAPPPVMYKLHVALGVGMRFTNLDAHDNASKSQFMEYGWTSARSPALPQFAGEVEYLLAPIVDLGVAVSTAHGTYAAGVDFNRDRVLTSTMNVSLVGKLHYAMGRPFIPEPRVDVGVVRRTIELHGVAAADSVPFVRAGMDWRLGTRRGGVQISAGYILTGRASSGDLDPAVGGLDVSLSPYVRF
jgi:hypothetical protein